MSAINFRLYGEQIYGLSQKYMHEYISPEIPKEDFVGKFKSGKLSYENISTNKEIQINPIILLNDLKIGKTEINIPNETENLSIYLNDVKTTLSLLEIKDNDLEKLLLDNRVALINSFISYELYQKSL